jgi:hypothetical protein
MARINTWTDFLKAVQPHLLASDPLGDLRAAGDELDGEVAAALERGRTSRALDPDVLSRLREAYGPLPAVSVQLGHPPLDVPSPVSTTGYAAVATVEMLVLNAVLAELYRVGTIPHQLTRDQTDRIITDTKLRELCTGVPDDVEMPVLSFAGPPVASASSISQRHIHLSVECVMQFFSETSSAVFIGTVGLEIPLDFQVLSAVVRPSHDAIQGLTGTLTIGGFSHVRPRSDAAHQQLQTAFVEAARSAFLVLIPALSFTASLPVNKSRFPNSTIDVTQVGAVSIRQSIQQSLHDYVVVGFNVERLRDTDPIGLIGQPVPVPPHTIHTEIDQQFATDALASIITSGDLGAFLTRVAVRNIPLFDNIIDVSGGRVRFGENHMTLTLDCVVRDFCEFDKDLAFTASVQGTPAIAKGTLTIDSDSADVNLDNTDALVCILTSGLAGPFGVIFYTAALGIAAAYNPNSSDLNIPVSETSEPLKGSDKVVDLQLTSATISPGVLTADGQLRLISDPLRTFVYLRIVEPVRPSGFVPVAGATVELYELDSPAPPGDDVTDPTSYLEMTTPTVQITEEVVYTPRADELLGSATTGRDGRVTFVAIANTVGGSATRTRISLNLHTGRETTTSSFELVGERLPDLGVTIHSPSQKLLTRRRLISLNLAGGRLGRFNAPVDVVVRPAPVLEDGS